MYVHVCGAGHVHILCASMWWPEFTCLSFKTGHLISLELPQNRLGQLVGG